MSNPEQGGPGDELELLLLKAELSKNLPSLDLHGLRVHEARSVLESFLNSSFMKGERLIEIVHGKGGGALKKVVRELLSTHPLVERFRDSTKFGQEGAVIYAVLAENNENE